MDNFLILDDELGEGFQSTIFVCMGKQYKRYKTADKIELYRYYFTGNQDCVLVDHEGERDEVLAAFDRYEKEYYDTFKTELPFFDIGKVKNVVLIKNPKI